MLSASLNKTFPSYHELHVSGARRLGSGQGDLLAEVGCRDDLLGHRHAVVLQEDQLQPVVHDRIVVDHLAHIADQFDYQLGHVVARSSLK